ncbi:pantoate--beta-alanine ligase [Henriciella aquimarina]|uniref:pantoate--beta-alanine ligase n=1 Tax=Henriciella aquimarina TaxID=545261 RepID=UPI000A024AF1|nr:pantoate--beta-alanine ligase [Henriciella aquimarina]
MTKQQARIYRTRTDLQAAIAAEREKGSKIGFVPTMGALHDGHISLVEKAGEKSECVVASIFVNPTQFAPGEDLDRYPRNEEGDVARLSAAGCDLVYCPSVEEMYPDGSLTNVRVEEMSDLLDGIHRPHFFYGVATVVARLFIHVKPDVAVFGEKDYQQLQIIRRMVRDLGFGIEIIGGSTWRDADGLAQSSRNAYLSEGERETANAISSALHRAACRLHLGRPVSEVLAEARAFILAAGFTKLDYVSAVDPVTLQDLEEGPLAEGQECRLLAAAWLGTTRLIDNIGV